MSPSLPRSKKIFRLITLFGVSVVLLILCADFLVARSSQNRVFTSIEETPHVRIGLLLGTSKFMSDGRENLFYKYRMDATESLYKAGVIEGVLVSGDNRTATYSEPDTMKADLIERGIPSSRITLDYAGFRTWDSVIRAKEVFQESHLLIISQQFQTTRALFIAQTHGIDAVGYAAKDVPVSRSPRIWIRERLARVNLLLDLLRDTQPHFLGEPLPIIFDEA